MSYKNLEKTFGPKSRRINCFSRLCHQICNRTGALILLLLVIGLSGCTTTANQSQEQPKSVYVLDKKEVVKHPNPLPYHTDVHLYDLTNRELGARLGYRLWDINHDGFVDMLDVLGPDGNLAARLYDFSQDGKVDLQKVDLQKEESK